MKVLSAAAAWGAFSIDGKETQRLEVGDTILILSEFKMGNTNHLIVLPPQGGLWFVPGLRNVDLGQRLA